MFYQQALILRLLLFFGRDVASSLTQQTRESIKNISKDSLALISQSLDTYQVDLHFAMASPIIILPLVKNNDPTSPIWVFQLGNLNIDTIDSSPKAIEYLELKAGITAINVEVPHSLLIFVVPSQIPGVREREKRQHFLCASRFLG